MKSSVIASIDSSNGRIEFEPAPGPVRIVPMGAIFVAEPLEPRAVLTTETVEATLREIRESSSEG